MKVATLEKFHLRGVGGWRGIKILGTQGWEKLGRGGKDFFSFKQGGDWPWMTLCFENKQFLAEKLKMLKIKRFSKNQETWEKVIKWLLLNNSKYEELKRLSNSQWYSAKDILWRFVTCSDQNWNTVLAIVWKLYEKCDSNGRNSRRSPLSVKQMLQSL